MPSSVEAHAVAVAGEKPVRIKAPAAYEQTAASPVEGPLLPDGLGGGVRQRQPHR
jgi:hypothetical protein